MRRQFVTRESGIWARGGQIGAFKVHNQISTAYSIPEDGRQLPTPPDNATVKPFCPTGGKDMPRNLTFLLLLALAVTAAAQDKAKSSPADKSMILALENAWNQAELHHDAEAADAILADTFISVDHHGQLETKAEYMAELKDTAFNPDQISNT